MAPKAKAAALSTLTNFDGKRKAGDDGGKNDRAPAKKIKSCNRTMSIEDARKHLAQSEAKVKAKNKLIRERQAEIRRLKEQLGTAERGLKSAQTAKANLEKKNEEARQMIQSDADLVIQKVRDKANAYYGADTACREAVEDVISLGDSADILRLVACVNSLNNETMRRCALEAFVAGHKSQQPGSELAAVIEKAVRALYLPVLDGMAKPTDHKVWPVIASAMTIGTRTIEDEEELAKEYDKLSVAVTEEADKMKATDPAKYGYYRASEDNCCILEILKPTYDVIDERGTLAKVGLEEAIKDGLLKSINEPEPAAQNFAMPEEAEIARKRGFSEIHRFLLSPTETSINLNLSKAGRMEVHRLIDHSMGYGKLSHSSVGSGRSRYLVVTKTKADSKEKLQKRKERKEKHLDMLVEMGVSLDMLVEMGVYSRFTVSKPPPNARMGLIFETNAELGMPKLKCVDPGSHAFGQIPAEFHSGGGVFIVAVKTSVTGLQFQRCTSHECVGNIGSALAKGAAEVEFFVVKK